MSISFAGFAQGFQYIGTPYAIAIQLGGIQGKCVPLHFDWTSYGAPVNKGVAVNVQFNLGTMSTSLLDKIRSVYIDNLNSNVPVFVQFPDTLFTVTAQPNSAGFYPVMTNDDNLTVAALNISTPVPSCSIYVTNIPIPPYTDNQISNAQFLASANLARSLNIQNSNYGTPALGDQFISVSFDCRIHNGNNSAQIFNTPRPSGFLYITHADIVGSPIVDVGTGNIGWSLESPTGGPVFFGSFLYNTVEKNLHLMGPLSGMNIKLDATSAYNFVTSGNLPTDAIIITCFFGYTFNPN